MISGSFDTDTAKEWVGDARMRVIETKARADADAGFYAPIYKLSATFTTYASGVAAQMENSVYMHAYKKRKVRMERLAERAAQEE